MPKELKSYTLFIASPGDIVNEKEIIKKLVDEWNRLQGRFKKVIVETTDWTDVFPEFYDRPQAIINEQIFDNSDLVVGLFWTKFGSPTGAADSGTEEEILRAIDQHKPLMLYFSDAHQAPSKIDSSEYEKIKKFRDKHSNSGLYKVFNSDTDFENKFRNDLSGVINKLIQADAAPAKAMSIDKKNDPVSITAKEKDETGATYKPCKEIEQSLKNNFPIYWKKLYGIIEPKSALAGGIRISSATNNKTELKKLKETVIDWEKKIESYTNDLALIFDNVDKFPDDEFKYQIVAKELWTVNGALTNMDAELARYKSAYNSIEAYKIKDTVKNIIAIINIHKAPRSITSPSTTGLGILSQSQTLLANVIGKGIRSEILHKLDPLNFPLMTRRSIWGLFFISDESDEFVVDQSKDGLRRTVHNWDYLYDYFTYYNHIIFLLMKEYFSKHKIKLKEKYKFGYVNLFLVDIYRSHSKEIEGLRKYKNLGS